MQLVLSNIMEPVEVPLSANRKVGLTRFHPTSRECDTVLHDPSPIYFDVRRVAEPCWCGLMSCVIRWGALVQSLIYTKYQIFCVKFAFPLTSFQKISPFIHGS